MRSCREAAAGALSMVSEEETARRNASRPSPCRASVLVPQASRGVRSPGIPAFSAGRWRWVSCAQGLHMKRLTRLAAVAATATVAVPAWCSPRPHRLPRTRPRGSTPQTRPRVGKRGSTTARRVASKASRYATSNRTAVYGRMQVKEPSGSWADRLTWQVGGTESTKPEAATRRVRRPDIAGPAGFGCGQPLGLVQAHKVATS